MIPTTATSGAHKPTNMLSALMRTRSLLLVTTRNSSICCLHRAFNQTSQHAHTWTQHKDTAPYDQSWLSISRNSIHRDHPKLRRTWGFRLFASSADDVSTTAAEGIADPAADEAAEAAPVDTGVSDDGLVRNAPFDKEYINFCALTGLLDKPMSMSNKPGGGYSFVLRVVEEQAPITELFQVEAVGALANEISSNLDKLQQGTLVQVTGKLARMGEVGQSKIIRFFAGDLTICDPPIPESIQTASSFMTQETPAAAAAGPYLQAGEGGMPLTPSTPAEATWMEIFMHYDRFYDQRLTKTARQPDFKSKLTGEAIWIEGRKTPEWVFSNLQKLPGNIPYTGTYSPDDPIGVVSTAGPLLQLGEGGMPTVGGNLIEECWMDLFMHPDKWWDNRSKKIGVSTRRPDFKRRDDGQPLWIEDRRMPIWVQANLYRLPGGYQPQQYVPPQQQQSYMPAYSGPNKFGFMPQQASYPKEADWMDLFNNYQSWFDNRLDKRTPKQPDFKHRMDSNRALWLDTAPQWVLANISHALPAAPTMQQAQYPPQYPQQSPPQYTPQYPPQSPPQSPPQYPPQPPPQW